MSRVVAHRKWNLIWRQSKIVRERIPSPFPRDSDFEIEWRELKSPFGRFFPTEKWSTRLSVKTLRFGGALELLLIQNKISLFLSSFWTLFGKFSFHVVDTRDMFEDHFPLTPQQTTFPPWPDSQYLWKYTHINVYKLSKWIYIQISAGIPAKIANFDRNFCRNRINNYKLKSFDPIVEYIYFWVNFLDKHFTILSFVNEWTWSWRDRTRVNS